MNDRTPRRMAIAQRRVVIAQRRVVTGSRAGLRRRTRVVERVPVRRRSRTSGTPRGGRARWPHHPLHDDCAAGALRGSPSPRAIRGIGGNRKRTNRIGPPRLRTDASGRRDGCGERERARRPSRVARQASPIATAAGRCPRATPRRDPPAGVCALRARRRIRPAARATPAEPAHSRTRRPPWTERRRARAPASAHHGHVEPRRGAAVVRPARRHGLESRVETHAIDPVDIEVAEQ